MYLSSLNKVHYYYYYGLSWIKTPIQTLGIVITDNEDNNYKYNFQNKIANLKTTLTIWKQRKLSIKGKITIINSLALAPLIYVSSVISTPQVINEINNIVQNFIWDGSTSKIAQKTLIQNIENGSLILFHFETKIKALQLSWIKRMSTVEASIWNTSVTVITLIDISAQITEFYPIKKYHYFIKKFTLSL